MAVSNVYGGIQSLHLSKQSILLSGHADGVIQLWDTRSTSSFRKLIRHVGNVTGVYLNDVYLYSGGHDKTFKVWDIRANAVLQDLPLPGIMSSLWSDSHTIRMAAGSLSIYSYENGSEELVQSPNLGHSRIVRSVCHFGTMIMTGGLDKSIRVHSFK